MAEYKCVPGPVGLTIGSKDSYDKAVRSYASIIDGEATDGWEFFLIQQIPVVKKAGCLASLFGIKDTQVLFNMLVFRRDEQ